MKNPFAGTIAAVALVGALLAATAPARADSPGAAIAAGVGGAALGAIVGGALAGPAQPVYGAAPAPVFVEEPTCWTERRPVCDSDGRSRRLPCTARL